MSTAPQTLQDLNTVLTSSASPAALLDKLMEVEGEVSLPTGSSHMTGDTELLRTYYCAYFFALFLCDEITEARFLSQRIPKGLANADACLQNTFNLLRAVWNKKHPIVYQILRQAPWPEILKPLAEAYLTHFRDKTLHDLSVAYGAIRPETAASYLDFDADNSMENTPNTPNTSKSATTEFISALTQRGWEYDSDTMLLKPKPRVTVASELDKIKIGQLAALLGTHGD